MYCSTVIELMYIERELFNIYTIIEEQKASTCMCVYLLTLLHVPLSRVCSWNTHGTVGLRCD